MAAVAFRGTTYPVVLPKLKDPRLHLAATITSLQVLGQVAFHFRLSIAQILLCLGTCGAIELALTLRRQKAIVWPASALLTGNGVAFVLRVPGTAHGDWWTLRGWWIFVATAGGALLSKHVIQWRGNHPFNPSNIGLVVCFIALGRTRVEPLEFWWGPMSWWMVLALGIIVTGGFAILSRLRLLRVALGFWAAFALSIGIVALAGHTMTARWYLGPITGFHFWWVLVTSPEVLVFLFFMITDPKTAPSGLRERLVYAVSLGVLAGALIAPTTSEFAAKVALLSSLAIVCAVKPLLRVAPRRLVVAAAAPALAAAAGVMLLANETSASLASRTLPPGRVPAVAIDPSPGVQSQLDEHTAELIAHDLVAAVPGAPDGVVHVHLVAGSDQGPPNAVAVLAGRTYRLHVGSDGRWSTGALPKAKTVLVSRTTSTLDATHLTDVAANVGIDFRQGSFRYGVSNDYESMMGGGVCFLDYNGDGWQDLFAVNSYSSADTPQWEAHGGLPTSALFENDHGTFRDVSKATHANIAVQGDGCAAGDLNGDGHTDLVVTTTTGAEILWNDGHGHFTERALDARGWYTGAAIADVNGDGRPDVFVAGYSDPNEPVQGSLAGFPTNLTGVRDLLFLNEGGGRFREVGVQAGLESSHFSHGLGATFLDANGDGRPDLYVANDEDPNELYVNVPWPGGAAADPAHLGFRFEERAAPEHVADPYAGMGVAPRITPTGALELFVSNSRNEQSAAFTRAPGATAFANARSQVDPALGTAFAGWGASWVDLQNSGYPALVLATGAIPVRSLSGGAEALRVLAPVAPSRREALGADQGVVAKGLKLNGRGLAAADVDNDGRVEVAVNTIGGRLALLRSTGPSGHWLDVALGSFQPGAIVTVTLPDGRRLSQPIAAGGSYLSSEDQRAHFGLGSATSVRSVVVRYPFGGERRLGPVAADRIVTVAGAPVRRAAPTAAVSHSCTPQLHGRSLAQVWDAEAVRVLRTAGLADPVAARDLYDLARVMDRARTPAAITPAAYRLLLWRVSFGANLAETFASLTRQLRALCGSPDTRSPVAEAAIAAGLHDGSNEELRYADPGYTAPNDPLILHSSGSTVHDATFWQPLALAVKSPQGVGAVPADVQTFAAAALGRGRTSAHVTPVGYPTSAAYRDAAVAVIRATASPAALPDSSPLSWNEAALALPSHGLAADLHLLLRLNGALHQAAIATWRAKRASEAPRPISMIRYLAFEDQLPLVPGLVERRHGTVLVKELGRWVPGAAWTPPLPTPASPGGVSERAAFAWAAARVLGRSFDARARQAAESGLRGGIDLPAAVAAGAGLGRR